MEKVRQREERKQARERREEIRLSWRENNGEMRENDI